MSLNDNIPGNLDEDEDIRATSLNGPLTNEITITDLVGAGLIEDAQDLRVATKIWDESEDEVVADVNNSLTQTDVVSIGSNEYNIDENNNGDLVIQDDNNNDVLTWVSSKGQWDFKSQDVTGFSSLDTDRSHITRQSPVLIGSVGWRSDFDGADADARLDNALSAASDGDTIHLEPATYTDDRTIDTEGVLKGGSAYISGAQIGSSTTWTLNDRVALYQIRLSGSVVVDTSRAQIGRLFGQGSITLKSGANILFALNGTGGPMSVTFENGTDSNIIDASANVAVTDKGSNTTGDIA